MTVEKLTQTLHHMSNGAHDAFKLGLITSSQWADAADHHLAAERALRDDDVETAAHELAAADSIINA